MCEVMQIEIFQVLGWRGEGSGGRKEKDFQISVYGLQEGFSTRLGPAQKAQLLKKLIGLAQVQRTHWAQQANYSPGLLLGMNRLGLTQL